MHESQTREFNYRQLKWKPSQNMSNGNSYRKCPEIVIDFLPKVYKLSLAPASLYTKGAKAKAFCCFDLFFEAKILLCTQCQILEQIFTVIYTNFCPDFDIIVKGVL